MQSKSAALRRHHAGFLTFLTLLAAVAPAVAGDPRIATTPEQGLWALELGVPDLDRAVEFYTSALGFEVVTADQAETWTLLGNGSARLALALSGLPVSPDGKARAYANFSVGSLDAAAAAVVAAGGSAEVPFESPVGRALRFLDPFGHPGHLIDHPWDEMSPGDPPAVFNVALNVRDVETSERFYTALGFEVRTRDYLPRTLVFEPRGSAQLILHPSASGDADAHREAGALLINADPGVASTALAGFGTSVAPATPATERTAGSTVEIRDPSGILLKLALRAGAVGVIEAPLSAKQAANAFERLKSLAGQWQAKSSQGWNEPVVFDVVAGGSVVVETNTFKEAPENTMYTMYHLDGERLMATHYCASGNQPRLVASGVSDDGRQLTFTYLDGTGLPSRDHGHMDQAMFRFLDADRFTARWTWYQEGAEKWLEEIEHRRESPVAAASP